MSIILVFVTYNYRSLRKSDGVIALWGVN